MGPGVVPQIIGNELHGVHPLGVESLTVSVSVRKDPSSVGKNDNALSPLDITRKARMAPIGPLRTDPDPVAQREPRRLGRFCLARSLLGWHRIGGSFGRGPGRPILDLGVDGVWRDHTALDQHALGVPDPLRPVAELRVVIGAFTFDPVAERVGVEPRRSLGELRDGEGSSLPRRVERSEVIDGDGAESGSTPKIVHTTRRAKSIHRGESDMFDGILETVHPLSTVLLLMGYGLALPIVARLTQLKARRHRLAIVGHQVGMTIALIGWAVLGRVPMVLIHLVWMIGVRIWFGNDRSAAP